MDYMAGVPVDCPHSISNLPQKLKRPRLELCVPCGGIVSLVGTLDNSIKNARGVWCNAK
jgi:hypothetical protein